MSNLKFIRRMAQAAANRVGKPVAIINLNPYSPLYVVREWKDDYGSNLVERIDPQIGEEA